MHTFRWRGRVIGCVRLFRVPALPMSPVSGATRLDIPFLRWRRAITSKSCRGSDDAEHVPITRRASFFPAAPQPLPSRSAALRPLGCYSPEQPSPQPPAPSHQQPAPKLRHQTQNHPSCVARLANPQSLIPNSPKKTPHPPYIPPPPPITSNPPPATAPQPDIIDTRSHFWTNRHSTKA
jgi:hypothetical protein